MRFTTTPHVTASAAGASTPAAAMRKLLILINAMFRDGKTWDQFTQHA